MKILLACVGLACISYTILAIVQMVGAVGQGNSGAAEGSSRIAASIAPVCCGLAGGIICFRYVFKKPKA